MVVNLMVPYTPGLPSKEYYKDEEIVQKYSATVGSVLEGLLREAQSHGILSDLSTRFSSRNEDLVKDIVDFETALASATPKTEDAQDVTKYYNPRTLAEAQTSLPEISLEYLISNLAPSGCKVDKLIVGFPSYLNSTSHLLKTTKLETIQAYLVWKIVQNYVNAVEDPALKPLLRFNNELRGKDPDASEERWRTCVKSMDQDLSWLLSKFFVDQAFSKGAKEFGDHIVSAIKDQFILKLKEVAWMSKDVKNLGIEKGIYSPIPASGGPFSQYIEITKFGSPQHRSEDRFPHKEP